MFSIVSASILPLALIAGLLSFPTVCACGAELPHEHALFALAHHTHASTSESTSGEQAHDQHEEHGRAAAEADTTGASLQAPGFSMSGATQAATLSTNIHDAFEQDDARISTDTGVYTGLVTRPESPPPQT
jgi:hypothetical protein